MSNSAYIRDIESLEQLRIAIARFCEESENQINAIDSKLQTRIGNLKSLESQFQKIIEHAKDDLRYANDSLSYCESKTAVEEEGNITYPDCEYERDKVYDCRRQLDDAEQNYSAFRREMRNLEISIAEYQNPKIKYKTLIQFEKEAATSSLKQLINGAEDYLSVSSTIEGGFSNGLGLAEAVAKIDPTMILSTAVGVAEIIVMSEFSFLGFGGSLFNVSNKSKKCLVTTTYQENGTDHICSELKIEKSETCNIGKIVSINIPSSLQTEKIGKSLISNMEITCRANDCKEISGWANSTNVRFYQGLEYQTRNEIKEVGAEVFKPLDSSFSTTQQNAKAAFENLTNADFSKNRKIGKQQVNPLNIISPDEMNDELFWQHHGEDQSRYVELVEKFDKCNQELLNGKTLDQIRKEDSWVANAFDVFNGSEPIRLLKSGDYFRIEGNGRHRVAAAQIYFMKTGKSVSIIAEVIEKE